MQKKKLPEKVKLIYLANVDFRLKKSIFEEPCEIWLRQKEMHTLLSDYALSF